MEDKTNKKGTNTFIDSKLEDFDELIRNFNAEINGIENTLMKFDYDSFNFPDLNESDSETIGIYREADKKDKFNEIVDRLTILNKRLSYIRAVIEANI